MTDAGVALPIGAVALADATLVLQTLGPDGEERLACAAEVLAKHARNDLGASCEWAIANADTPVVTLPPRIS